MTQLGCDPNKLPARISARIPTNVSFREQLRRTFSSNRNRRHGTEMAGDEPDEETGLLSGLRSSRSHLKDALHAWAHPDISAYENSNLIVRSAAHCWRVTTVSLASSPVNILLPCVPLGIIAGELGWSPGTVFALNFFGIIPLAALLTFATENLSARMGDTIGGLVNATFGNAVELIVSIVALRAGEIEVVQASMLGSILSNLLLVTGMCFFLGGIYNMAGGAEQSFASGTAQTTCSLMALSSGSLVLPAALYSSLSKAKPEDKEQSIVILSRGTAVILLVLYCIYLYFQIVTHKNLFEEKPKKPKPTDEETPALPTISQGNGLGAGVEEASSDSEEDGEPEIGVWPAIAMLTLVTVVISVCADYLVGSIDSVADSGYISKPFIGLILIPIVGNAAEHVTACVVAVRNKMDMAMGVAIGSSIQIALLVTPALVLVGWAMGQPMTLHFETFETIAFALSVVIVASMVQDGKSNYLEGAMLMGFYVIIALAFWASPPDALDKS